MVAISQGEWLARGRAHQSEGRAIDALQCFRQAQRVAPRAIAPRFLLGQLLWQLGKVQDAIVAMTGWNRTLVKVRAFRARARMRRALAQLGPETTE